MKIAIMQPYFLPYLGYLSLIYHSDHFVFFDTPQYVRKSWYERNRISKLGGGFSYIKVPIKKSPIGTRIFDIEIDGSKDWEKRIFSQLEIYKKSPRYSDVIKLIERAFEKNCDKLYLLNIELIKEILSYLNISRKIDIYSQMGLELNEKLITQPDDWALYISESLGAKEYINAPGGKSFFSKDKYLSKGIELKFIEQPLKEYKQLNTTFEPGLSIIDVLMCNNPEDVVIMLQESSLFT